MIATEVEIDLCQFHEWFPLLQHVSIKSNIVEVDQSFVEYLGKDGLFVPGEESWGDESSSSSSSCHSNKLLALKNELSNSIKSLGGETFVKLNWSAPIDAIWVNSNSAKCQNSDDVFCLLKSSDRVIFDLEKMYNLCCNPSKQSPSKQYIVVRKWANLTPSMEFRMFVFRNHLVGICQRECSTFFSFLLEQLDSIEEKLQDFYDKEIAGKLPLESFVLDVYIDRKSRIWVIDVNPFGAPTSPLMFEWEDFEETPDFYDFRIVQNESETYKRTLGSSRGPIDVHMSEDFSKFMDICKAQNEESSEED